jgi:hypothetical protein
MCVLVHNSEIFYLATIYGIALRILYNEYDILIGDTTMVTLRYYS